MKIYLFVSSKSWHDELFEDLTKSNDSIWFRIKDKEDLNFENISKIQPNKIFIPHWSHFITDEIYLNFECIVFHMTDLPYGRGGSPLQNLIVRGKIETKISALRVEKELDAGPIYLKKALSLAGTAREIFERSSSIVGEMIKEINTLDLLPSPQTGEIVLFKRRKQEDGNIAGLKNIMEIFDYIRMLDCEGYPNAFLETEFFRLEFFSAKVETNVNVINSNVRIFKK